MQLFKHYEQIYKYFAEGKQKDNSAQNSKFLQLHNVKVSDYLTKKYALSLEQQMRIHYMKQNDGKRMQQGNLFTNQKTSKG